MDRGFTSCSFCDSEDAMMKSSNEVVSIPSNVQKFRDRMFTVWRCMCCRSLHTKEDVELKEFYDGYPMQNQKLDYGTLSAFKTRMRFLKRQGIKKKGRILDYGCSNGLFVRYLCDQGYEAVGYDPYVKEFSSEEALDKKYDAIVTYDVIEHATDPREFLSKLRSMLSPGGLLVVGTPNASKISLSKPEIFQMELHQPYHRHIFSESALIRLCEDSGFKFKSIRRRFCFDTRYPFINAQFIWRYVRKQGNYLDVVTDMPKPNVILANPSLIFWGLFGYLIPHRGTMVASFDAC